MSKKILKRSLALGALMAFVITGSAMAAELTIEYDNGTYTATGTGISGSVTGNAYGEFFNALKQTDWASGYKTNEAIRYGEEFSQNVYYINGGSGYDRIVGSYNNNEGDVVNNVVNIKDAEITKLVYAGVASKGDVIGNVINATNVQFGSVNIFAGVADKGNNIGAVKENKVIIENSNLNNYVAAGYAYGSCDASNNEVIIKNCSGSVSVYGGLNYEQGNLGDSDNFFYGDSYNNKVTIFIGDGNLNVNGPYGDCSYGGDTGYGNSYGNEVIINADGNGCLSGMIAAGYSKSYGDVSSNKLIVNAGNVNSTLIGGGEGHHNGKTDVDGNGSLISENEVIVNGGNITGSIFAGKSTHGSTNNNIVTINGGSISSSVYGGHSDEGNANDNTVNISGSADVSNADIFGSNKLNSTGNTLNIGDGWSGKINKVEKFNNINFGKKAYVETNVTLGSDAAVNLADGDDYTSEYAIKGELTVDSANATLTIGNIKETTYNIASGYNDTDTTWTLENDLMNVKEWKTNGQLQVTVEAKSADEIATNLGVSEGTASLVEDIISNDNANAEAVQFVENVMNSGVSKEVAQEAYAAMEKMAEAGGQSATAARIVNNVTGVTNDRLSFNCGHSAPHKGGHGVGLFEEGSGADIWVEYVHGKDKVEDMKSSNGASSYEGQYNGFVMGVDFKKVNTFQSGIAFNYGEGDTNSVGSSARTHSDYDFWGVGYYGNIHNDDSNVIFDINYAKTDSDVTQNSAGGILEASPETTTLSAGVKVEKLYQNENVQIVPYTGLRFMSIDTDDYATKGGGFMYNMERQNIWLLPVGVSIKQEIVNDNGWVVSPRVDLSYIWAFGDTNSNMEVKSGNGISPIWYDVMDDGSFLGLVGIEAHKGQWGYGVAYSYQKGDHSESKKWFVDVNYSF